VLEVQNNMVLILSDRIIEKRAYHGDFGGITWEKCDLRKYLNSTFYSSFSADEKARIAEERIVNNNNPRFGTEGGINTTDKIFLLSIGEITKYFGDSGLLRNEDPEGNYWVDDRYNAARIATDNNGEVSWWWLRSPGDTGYYASDVYTNGTIHAGGVIVTDTDGGVRPALWLNLQIK